MTVRVIVATHAPKGTSTSALYWKPDCPLDQNKIGVVRAVARKHFTGVTPAKVFHSDGFVRTEDTAEELTGFQSEPCVAIGPYAVLTDSEWRQMDPDDNLLASEFIRRYPGAAARVGKAGGDFIRAEVAAANDGDVLVFVTHRDVAEPIVDDLLKDWAIGRLVTDFGQGDLTFVDYDGNSVRSTEYHSAAKALADVGAAA